jgi:prepilin-type N-terminal cleavage/methylation domain-containing protein
MPIMEGSASALPRFIAKLSRSRAAFSLIELLASLAILLIIVGILGMIYIHFDKAWTQGTGKADCNTTGQASLNIISRDLEHAVADDILTFAMQPDRYTNRSYGCWNDEICFVSMESTNLLAGATNRTALEVQYWVRNAGGRYELVRGCLTNDIALPTTSLANCYWNTNWYKDASQGGVGRPGNAAVVAENVAGVSFIAPGETVSGYESTAHTNRLPEYVDICLELLDETSAKQAAQLSAADPTYVADFAERKIRRYTTRVFFENRSGYRMR